jgi:hypothetical protein
MAQMMIAHPTNGAPPRIGPLFRARVDELATLREKIRELTDRERQITRTLTEGLQAHGLTELAGTEARAILETRTTLKPDPGLVLDALGPKAIDVLTVSLTALRRVMVEADIEAISETTTAPVLRVVAVNGGRP